MNNITKQLELADLVDIIQKLAFLKLFKKVNMIQMILY
jgi:hypothetical protein